MDMEVISSKAQENRFIYMSGYPALFSFTPGSDIMTQDMTKGKIMPMLIRFNSTCTGKSVPAYLQRRRQHYCGTFYRKRGTGRGRYLQSGHDIGHSVSEWSVHGREYSDWHVLRGERLRYSLSPDQYDYDFRICIFCNSNHSQYWNCEITSQIATGRRIYFGYDDFLPSHHICRTYVYIFI